MIFVIFSGKQEAGLAAEVEDGGWRSKCYRYEERCEMVSQDSESANGSGNWRVICRQH